MATLYDVKAAWPPKNAASDDVALWLAWYSGAPNELARVSVSGAGNGKTTALVRGFWARHARDAQADRSLPQPVHVPLAAEIAATSADLLFGDMPSLTVKNSTAQKRLDELMQRSIAQSVLLEAFEVCAALGGAYLRVSWDTDVDDVPFISAVYPDHAVPEFRWGRLAAVTFWREVERDGKNVYRHLERYEPGFILNTLHRGTDTQLGVEVSLESHSATARLIPEVALPEALRSRLACVYAPNVRPNRRAPQSPQGRADIQGAESELDSLDETWSSWMRDLRLGQARVLVSRKALEAPGRGRQRGKGRALDLDRAFFTELDFDPERADPITLVQFKLRVAEHEQTATALVERITSGAGYSPQTFGLHIEGRAESGTALKLREGKTEKTMARKQRYATPALVDLCEVWLAVDAAEFKSGVAVERPSVEWQEERESDLDRATVAEMISRARAASTQTLVEMVHPDWSEQQIAAEVLAIQQEQGMRVMDPMQAGLLG